MTTQATNGGLRTALSSAIIATAFTYKAVKSQSSFWLFPATCFTDITITGLANQVFPFLSKERDSWRSFTLRKVIEITSTFGTCAAAEQLGMPKALTSKILMLYPLRQCTSVLEKALEPLVDKIAKEVFKKWPVQEIYKEPITKTVVVISSIGCVAGLAGFFGIVPTATLSLFLKVSAPQFLFTFGIYLVKSIRKEEETQVLWENGLKELPSFDAVEDVLVETQKAKLFKELPNFVAA